MHDPYGLGELKERWFNWKSPKRLILMPLRIVKQLVSEGSNNPLAELTAVKDYFGEKVGFNVAWVSFYTAWLFVPGILGLTLTIYQLGTENIESKMAPLYSILIAIWATVLIEMWKRKSAEIAANWGVTDFKEKNVVREGYVGDEYHSKTTFKVGKRSSQLGSFLIFLASLPILLALLTLCVFISYYSNQIKRSAASLPSSPPSPVEGTTPIQDAAGEDQSFFERNAGVIAGVVNGIAISLVDFIYLTIAEKFVSLENHATEDEYERSFVFKLFAFKFINTNMPLFYLGFIERNFLDLYYHLVGMTL